jgi:hypothetical protein
MVPLISAPRQRNSLYFSLFAGNSRGETVSAKTACFPQRGGSVKIAKTATSRESWNQLAASRRRGAVARAQEEVCSAGLRIRIETGFFCCARFRMDDRRGKPASEQTRNGPTLRDEDTRKASPFLCRSEFKIVSASLTWTGGTWPRKR